MGKKLRTKRVTETLDHGLELVSENIPYLCAMEGIENTTLNVVKKGKLYKIETTDGYKFKKVTMKVESTKVQNDDDDIVDGYVVRIYEKLE